VPEEALERALGNASADRIRGHRVLGDTIEAEEPAEQAWLAHVGELAENTLFVLADSWYLGANIPGKPRVFMPYAGGLGNYRTRCNEVVDAGNEGFALTAS